MKAIILVVCLWCAATSTGFSDVIIGTAGGVGQVRVVDGQQVIGLTGLLAPGMVEHDIFPFGTLSNGSRVATGDVNGDGTADFVAGTGPIAQAGQVHINDGQSGVQLSNFFAFNASYTGGANVATGDVHNDNSDDVIVGAATGLAHVRVIDASSISTGEVDPSLVSASFFAFSPTFTGGVTVASGDVNNDGRDDIITGAATGVAHVRMIDGTKTDDLLPSGEINSTALAGDFFAFSTGYSGGVNVAAGDVNGDGFDDIIVGAATGIAHVRVIDGTRLGTITGEVTGDDLLADFFAYTPTFTGGVNVAAGDINGDGLDDIVLGPATGLAHVRIVDATQVTSTAPDGTIAESGLLADFLAFDLGYSGGIFVAASSIPEPSSLALIVGLLAVGTISLRSHF